MKQKHLAVFREAVRLADSGEYKDWHGIEKALIAKGYRKAEHLLDGEKIRAVLDIHCDMSRNVRKKAH